MKQILSVLSSTVIILLMMSCTGPIVISNEISACEPLLKEKPDSALHILETIDRNELRRPPLRARHALLYSIALDKNYIDTADISVIKPAVDYYSRHGSSLDRLRTDFYLGRVYYNAKDYQKAALSFKEAEAKAEKSGDLYWRAMTKSWLGYTYNENFCPKEELAYLLEALPLWEEYGDSTEIMYALSNLAMAYHNNSKTAKADSLYAIVMNDYNPIPETYFCRASIEAKQDHPDPGKVIGWIETGISMGGQLSIQNYYEYAYALVLAGRKEESDNIMSQFSSLPEDEISTFWGGRIAMASGNDSSAAAMLLRHFDHVDRVVREQLSQSIYRAESDHYHLQAEITRKQKAIAHLISTLIAIISVLLFITISIFHKRRQTESERQIQELHALAEESERMLQLTRMELSSQNEQADQTYAQLFNLRKVYAILFKSQFEVIASAIEHDGADTLSKKSRNRVESILEELNHDGQDRFERRIDEALEGIMTKLRKDFPEFSEDDFRFLSFVIAGFDATTRAIILNESVNNMRVRKSRLLTKIHSRHTENSSLYDSYVK